MYFGREMTGKFYIYCITELDAGAHPSHRIIFPYSSDRMKRSRTFFVLSPRVLKFCMITPTHILNKIGGGQNLSQKLKYFSILIFVWKMVKSGKFWTKNGIPAFLAHNRR